LIIIHMDDNQVNHGGKREGTGPSVKKYFLSIDCFLKFCLLAKTEQGEKIFSALIARFKTAGIQQTPQDGGLTEAQVSQIVMEQNRQLVERLEKLEAKPDYIGCFAETKHRIEAGNEGNEPSQRRAC